MTKYVAMSVQDWNGFKQDEADDLQVDFNVNVPEGCSGYLPVYDSIEALHAVLPGAEFMPIEVTTIEGKK